MQIATDIKPVIGFLSGMKNNDPTAILIPFNQFIDSGKLFLWEIQYTVGLTYISFSYPAIGWITSGSGFFPFFIFSHLINRVISEIAFSFTDSSVDTFT